MASQYVPQILSRVRSHIDWGKMASKGGNTQERERYYIGLVQEAITHLGGTFTAAASQKSVDIQDIQFPEVGKFHIEGKASVTEKFMLNDTMIKPDIYYLFVYSKHHVVDIELGMDVIRRTTDVGPHNRVEGRTPMTKDQILRGFQYLMDEATYSVRCGVMSLFDFGEMWKQTWKFGKLLSRPRPNWQITIPRRPTELVAEAPHSPPGPPAP